MARADFSPERGVLLTDFLVATDVAHSRNRSMGVPSGAVLLHGEPTIIA